MLRRMLGIARQQRWMIYDIFTEGEALITTADEKSRDRVLSKDEEKRLLAECVGPRLHLRPLVIAGIDTGMRRGELLLLRWEDVNFERGKIVIIYA